MAKTTQTTCPRCAGSGHYSFHLVHGTVCFKCGGSGIAMVDLKTQARNKKATEKRRAERDAYHQMMRNASRAVISEMIAIHGGDASTELGIDVLNRKVWEATGRTIWQIRDERLKSESQQVAA